MPVRCLAVPVDGRYSISNESNLGALGGGKKLAVGGYGPGGGLQDYCSLPMDRIVSMSTLHGIPRAALAVVPPRRRVPGTSLAWVTATRSG